MKPDYWWGDQKVMWGTAALTNGKEEQYIGRDFGDFFFARSETERFWIGDWITGYGFVNVKFPKNTVRELSWVEIKWLQDHPVGF